MEYLAEIRNVSKKFGDETVVRDVTMSLEAGKIYGVAGRNGSGKTVLFKMIIGFLRPSSGKIFVHGKEIGKDVDFAEDIGIIIETPGFLGSFNGYKNLEYLACIKKQIGKEEIRESMRQVGLDPDSKKKVKKYSLGMRQRLGIAQAIMEHPGAFSETEKRGRHDPVSKPPQRGYRGAVRRSLRDGGWVSAEGCRM